MSLELEVDDVAAGGDGIARTDDGRVVFVRGGVPGDRLTAEVVRSKPRLVHAVAAAVHRPSPDRTEPPCPHVAAGCGGCGWQHITPPAQIRWKLRIAEETLRRIGRVDPAGAAPVVAGPALPTAGFRTTLRCLVTADGLAFRGARSHRSVPVDSCLVAHPGIADLVASAASGDVSFGDAGEVTLRIGAATGERLVVVDAETSDGVRLPDDVIVVGVDAARAGDAAHFHDVVGGHRFRISARSFFQTRTDGAAALTDAVGRALGAAHDGGHLVDLYGGVGLFAAAFGPVRRLDGTNPAPTIGRAASATVVESSRSSVADAVHNLAGGDVTGGLPDRGVEVVRTAVERWRPVPADAVVADPPRAGLGRNGVAVIEGTGAARVVLVSCDPASFARDVGLLAEAGYRRAGTELIDLFPHTPHLELVSSFDRGHR